MREVTPADKAGALVQANAPVGDALRVADGQIQFGTSYTGLPGIGVRRLR